MSKMLEATCVGGIVTADGVPVPTAQILSEGVGSSSGVLLLDGNKAKYIPKITPDLRTTLEQTIAALNQVVTALNKIGTTLTSLGAGIPILTPPPTLAADVAVIVAASVQVQASSTQLNALKEMLK